MVCPILRRFGLDRTECAFELTCKIDPRNRDLRTKCAWADWHMLDPNTGKPVGGAGTTPQGDLFGK